MGDNRLCQPFDDHDDMLLLSSQVELDFAALSMMTSKVQTYSSVCTKVIEQLLLSARKNKMTVTYVVWIE